MGISSSSPSPMSSGRPPAKVWIGGKFNKPIAGILWPAAMKQLIFGLDFNQPIDAVVWPARLQELVLGYAFN